MKNLFYNSFSQLSDVTSNPWCSLSCSCITPVSLLVVTSLSILVTHDILFLYGHQSYWIKAHPNDLIVIGLYVQRLYFQMRLHSQVPGIRTSKYLSGAHNSTPKGQLHLLTSATRCLPLQSQLSKLHFQSGILFFMLFNDAKFLVSNPDSAKDRILEIVYHKKR